MNSSDRTLIALTLRHVAQKLEASGVKELRDSLKRSVASNLKKRPGTVYWKPLGVGIFGVEDSNTGHEFIVVTSKFAKRYLSPNAVKDGFILNKDLWFPAEGNGLLPSPVYRLAAEVPWAAKRAYKWLGYQMPSQQQVEIGIAKLDDAGGGSAPTPKKAKTTKAPAKREPKVTLSPGEREWIEAARLAAEMARKQDLERALAGLLKGKGPKDEDVLKAAWAVLQAVGKKTKAPLTRFEASLLDPKTAAAYEVALKTNNALRFSKVRTYLAKQDGWKRS